ncbi:HOOK protein-domain-containing protein [Pelagophyceae sp. CCMP2097]|nr:HOOK protein-domain-containing protein [Pelagophyceae sp. CCMP2097]|mmetsp:Transcript_26429/g.88882  ORF Transcript_26429/g.88882 Transcript_26429/m.88882 type:complete len:694 (+) Transcript_26429:67-2148(+)
MAVESEALLAWLQTFEGIGALYLGDLKDGRGLTRVICELLDDDDACAANGGDAARVQALLSRLAGWYKGEGYTAESLMSGVSAAAVLAGDERAIGKLLQVVLGVAVRCARRAMYIGRILALDDSIQATMMVIVERVLQSAGHSPRTPNEKTPQRANLTGVSAPSFADEDVAELRCELDVARGEIARLKDARDAAVRDRDAVSGAAQADGAEVAEELRAAVERHERSMHELSKVRSKLQAAELEDDSLRERLAADARRHKEALLERNALEKKNASLNDEVDVLRAASAKLDRSEAHVEKLKRRIEELNSARKEMKDVDDQNAQYLSEMVRLERELVQLKAGRNESDKLGKVLSARNLALEAWRAKAEQSESLLAHMRDELDEAASKRAFYEDELRASGAREPCQSEQESGAFYPVFAEDASQLRQKIARLERDRVRDATGDDTLRARCEQLERALAERDSLDARAADADAQPRRRLSDSGPQKDQGDVFGEGDAVEAMYRGKDQAFPGRIARDHGDGFYDVEYDGGETEERVDAKLITCKDDAAKAKRRAAALKSVVGAQKSMRDSPAREATLVSDLAASRADVARLNSGREHLERLTRQTLTDVKEKYSVLVQTYKNQLREKDDKVSHLEAARRHDRAAHKREEHLVVSAVYDLGYRIIEQNLAQLHGNSADHGDSADRGDGNRGDALPEPPP